MCVLGPKRGITTCLVPKHEASLPPWSTWARAEYPAAGGASGKGPELVIPNPKLKLLDQVREVLNIKH